MAKKPGAAVRQVLRAASYCRTSGEGQRDNTSIPRQKVGNEEFIARNGWEFAGHYVDECKSGSKEEGREDFQRLMRDAANDRFDIAVVFDIKRFSRKGLDILRNAEVLRDAFGKYVVDTKFQYDSRDRRKTLINYVHAGVSEQERLDIMERMIGGRIARAQQGVPWAGNRPFGRQFEKTGKAAGKWYVTERGEKMRQLLEHYADGESLISLHKQYGFSSPAIVLDIVRRGQLSGQYVVKFNAPDLDIVDLCVPVPSIPEVITPELASRVRDRMDHNRSWNRDDLRKYLLTSYVFCSSCGRSLTCGRGGGHVYYRHDHKLKRDGRCGFNAIRADVIEPHALNYLFNFFCDEPSFEEAVKNSLPTVEDRTALENDIKCAEGQLNSIEAKIKNLISAIEGGAEVSLLLARQNELKTERAAISHRIGELEDTLAGLPDPVLVKRQASALRLQLFLAQKGKNWRKMPYDEIRRFLRYLFGDNTKKTGHGIFVSFGPKGWTLRFSGRLEFHHDVVNGSPRSHLARDRVREINEEVQCEYQKALAEADRGHRNRTVEAEAELLRANRDNSLSHSGFSPAWRASRVR
jgi:DNA invertase Pin-like site-specific DNA recombinase